MPKYLNPLLIHLNLNALTEEEKHAADTGIASDLLPTDFISRTFRIRFDQFKEYW